MCYVVNILKQSANFVCFKYLNHLKWDYSFSNWLHPLATLVGFTETNKTIYWNAFEGPAAHSIWSAGRLRWPPGPPCWAWASAPPGWARSFPPNIRPDRCSGTAAAAPGSGTCHRWGKAGPGTRPCPCSPCCRGTWRAPLRNYIQSRIVGLGMQIAEAGTNGGGGRGRGFEWGFFVRFLLTPRVIH